MLRCASRKMLNEALPPFTTNQERKRRYVRLLSVSPTNWTQER
jgi:hypothetical protein